MHEKGSQIFSCRQWRRHCFYSLKRPSHRKLKLANSCWQTQLRLVCVNGIKTVGQKFASVFADCFYAVHTHQLEFANTSLPTLVCRVKAALKPPTTSVLTTVTQTLRNLPSASYRRLLKIRQAGKQESREEEHVYSQINSCTFFTCRNSL